jgi:serine/threonine protein kinase
VGRFYSGGSLVSYLRGLEDSVWSAAVGGGNGNGKDKGRAFELLKIMLEISKGMRYLQSRGVLHGDLKVRHAFNFLPRSRALTALV